MGRFMRMQNEVQEIFAIGKEKINFIIEDINSFLTKQSSLKEKQNRFEEREDSVRFHYHNR